MAKSATKRRPRKSCNDPGFFENAVETGVRFTLLFTIMWTSSESLSTFGGPRKPKDVPVPYHDYGKTIAIKKSSSTTKITAAAPRTDQLLESRSTRDAPPRRDFHQECDDTASIPCSPTHAELLTRLHDGKESALSPVALQLQREARAKLHERHARLNEQNRMLAINRATRAQASKVAQMDRDSLAILEAATARSALLMQRSQRPAVPIRDSQCSGSEAHHTPDQEIPGFEFSPPRSLGNRIPAPRTPCFLPRTYSGTSPFVSPSSCTGSSQNIHPLDEENTTDSDLFRSDCQKLFQAPLDVTGSPLDVHEATSFLDRLHKAREMDPATRKIHDWMEGEIESAARGALERSGGKVDLGGSQALFEQVLGLVEDGEEGGGVMGEDSSDGEGASDAMGNLGSVWSWDGADSGSVKMGGGDGLYGEEGADDDAENDGEANAGMDEDDCEWLDLGVDMKL